MVKEWTFRIADSLVAGGRAHGRVAEALNISRTICRWLSPDWAAMSPKNRTGRGRKSSVGQLANIIMVKSVMKREQLTNRLGD